MGFTTFASFFAFRMGYRVSSTEVGLVEKDEAREEEEGGLLPHDYLDETGMEWLLACLDNDTLIS